MTEVTDKPLVVGIVAGEESGQLLAADIVDALARQSGRSIKLVGVGGEGLAARGLTSLFDPSDIALMGVSSVVASLPKLISRIRQTADAFIAAKPDCLLLVDSPEFARRVAKRVKAAVPDVPVVKYVAPTVWAWRPGRAAAMKPYTDMVLAILPFEPDVMERLGGPVTHYVGHRLATDSDLQAAWEKHASQDPDPKVLNLVVLPGSRRAEINGLMQPFGDTLQALAERGHTLKVTLPTLPRLEHYVRRLVANWVVKPQIVTGREAQMEAYMQADVALAASGTVTLELALAGVPAISCYKVDPMMKLATGLITTWSAALPNLIADRPVIREFYNEQVRPGMLARCVEELVRDRSHQRAAVMEGYALVRERMWVAENPADLAARHVLSLIAK